MARTTTNDAASQLEDLRKALREADQLSQDTTADLVALARSALRCLAMPTDRTALADARELLDLVHERAEELCNSINVLAERQGCNYVEGESHG